jgi:CubicO group peptidase (beta-lactamase class C family)
MKMLQLIIVLLLVISTSSVAKKSSESHSIQARIALLNQLLEEQRILYKIPGLSIAIVKDGQVILSKGFGLKNLSQNKPVTSSTIFPIGSISKSFTATLAGIRVDDGVINWDDPIANYLPEYQFLQDGKHLPLTIRDALSHNTGYGRNDTLWANPEIMPLEVIKAAPNAKPIAKYRSEFNYNNVMYLAAGMATAFDSSYKWDKVLEERVLKPIGMVNTTAEFSKVKSDPQLSLGYYWDDVDESYRILQKQDLENIAPATGIYSNSEDMAKWLQFLLSEGKINEKQLIKAETIAETFKPTTKVSPIFSYGLGWYNGQYKDQVLIEHSGNGEGNSSQIAFLPDSNIGFVLLTNVSITPLQTASINLVFDTLLNDLPKQQATTQDYSNYLGNYVANFEPHDNVQFTFKMHGTKPALNIPGQPMYLLKDMDENGKLYFEITDQVAISFILDDVGQVESMTLYEGDEKFELPKQEVIQDNTKLTLKEKSERQKITRLLSIKEQKKAYEALGPLHISGRLLQKQSGVKGDFHIRTDGYVDYTIKQDFGKYGKIETKIFDTGGINKRLRHGYQLKGKYFEQALREHLMHFLYWDKIYKSISIKERSKLDEKIVVNLKGQDLPDAKAIIAPHLAQVVSIKFLFVDPVWGQYPREIIYSDYRTIEGVNIPHRIKIDDHETGVTVLNIETLNCKLCASHNKSKW